MYADLEKKKLAEKRWNGSLKRKTWIKNNRSRYKEKEAEYNRSEKKKENNRKYRKTHKTEVLIARQRRIAREKNLPRSLTKQEWLEIIENQNGICAICSKPFTNELPPSQDHIIPVSRGGGYVKENIQAAHLRCNIVKGNK